MSEAIEPRAYLRKLKRNTKKGVSTRSKIIRTIKDDKLTIGEIARLSGLKVNVVRYHLAKMALEGVVERVGRGRGSVWRLTGTGQRKLDEEL